MPEQLPGLRLQRLLLMGVSELALDRSVDYELRRQVLLANTAEAGLITRRLLGGLGLAWKVVQPAGGGDLVVLTDPSQPFTGLPAGAAGVDKAGNLLTLTTDVGEVYKTLDGITIPDDAVWRTLVVRYAPRATEPGTISVTSGSATVTGVGTQFTRLTSQDDLVSGTIFPTADETVGCTRIQINDAVLNPGLWEIESIASDTSMTLTATATANESGVPFTVKGRFEQDDDPANLDLLSIPDVEFELVARTRYAADDDLILADVMLDTGSSADVQIIDRRVANLWQPMSERYGTSVPHLHLQTIYQTDNVTAAAGGYDFMPANVLSRPLISASNEPWVRNSSIAPRTDGIGMIAALGTDEGIRVCQYTTTNDRWNDRAATGGSRVYIDTSHDWSIARSSVKLIALPPQTGFTHLCLYQHESVIYSRRSTDNGATWSSEATVWDLTGGGHVYPGVTLEMFDAILLRSHRILAATVTGALGVDGVRFFYSDDYGTSWQLNSGDGWLLADSENDYYPALCELDDATVVMCTRGTRATADSLLRKISPVDFTFLDTPVPVFDPLASPHTVDRKWRDYTADSTPFSRAVLLPGPNNTVWMIEQLNEADGGGDDVAGIVARCLTLDTMSLTWCELVTIPLVLIATGPANTDGAEAGLSACISANGSVQMLVRHQSNTSGTDEGFIDHYTAIPSLVPVPWAHGGGPFDGLVR